MGTRYRVSVERIDDTPESGEYSSRDTLLFEATHADPVRLARFAPAEVLEALAAGAGIGSVVPLTAGGDRLAMLRTEAEAYPNRLTVMPDSGLTVGQIVDGRMGDGAVFTIPAAFGDASTQVPQNTVTATAADTATPGPQAETPKRKRRTKEQIQADNEAQSLGYRDAAHRAGAESERHPMATSPEAIAAGGMPTPVSEAAGAELFGTSASGPGKDNAPDAGTVAMPAPASPPQPVSAPETVADPAPWNPFG